MQFNSSDSSNPPYRTKLSKLQLMGETHSFRQLPEKPSTLTVTTPLRHFIHVYSYTPTILYPLYHHKLPPGIKLVPLFFLSSTSFISLACSIIFPSLSNLSASAATFQTISRQLRTLFPLPTSPISYVLGLSDLEYSFNLPTKSLNSCCLPTRFSRLRFCRSGLYFRKSSSSVGET
jgi:hypothetical protein